MNVQYKGITALSELEKANQLIEKVWGLETGISIYLLKAQINAGGKVLGAYKEENLIGISYGFPGVDNRGFFFYSHLLAVDPEYRGLQLGTALKLYQGQIVQEAGFNRMKWTFDPLESRNAHVNFKKCHVTSREYYHNFYGVLKDNLNEGISSDRLMVEWRMQSVSKPKLFASAEIRNSVKFGLDKTGKIPIFKEWLLIQDSHVKLAIPSSFQGIKEHSLQEAMNWRTGSGEVFKHYLNLGYAVIDFDYEKNRPVQFYILGQPREE